MTHDDLITRIIERIEADGGVLHRSSLAAELAIWERMKTAVPVATTKPVKDEGRALLASEFKQMVDARASRIAAVLPTPISQALPIYFGERSAYFGYGSPGDPDGSEYKKFHGIP